ncbi:S24 family peptidase [Croceicoccus sp. BE223]|uniref:S24 family peptidase n=1 Tax=Croceicoccus sp. BE223 TaxID=2817716 RepID=UPI002856F917|nr:S24 family peptidase [Croceicoccus sp. BE223]MDR7101494.1 phage repressor protein C with HTH and peptisase S24 domain [Croceicoccus sp. BE223]
MDTRWIKDRKKARGITDAALADALGVERSVANKIVNGKVEINARRVEALAELLDVSRDEMLFRAGITSTRMEPEIVSQVPSSELVQIQKLDLSLSMGPGTLIDGYVEAEPVTFDLAFIRAITRSPSDKLRLVTGIGDSMYPTLNWGDAIMIDTADRQLARQDGIYWIDLYGAAGIKRLRTIGRDRVLVISDNPAMADQEVDTADLRIEGRAIWVARGL